MSTHARARPYAASMMPLPRLVTLTSGATLGVVDIGSGEPIVLIHGSLCDYRYWQPQIAALAATYRVLSISLNHYFPTRQQNCALPFGWRAHVDQVAELIDSVVGDAAHVVGHSRGAYLALHVARLFASSFRTMTLADPGGVATRADARGASPFVGSVNVLRAQAVTLIEQSDSDAGIELFVDSVSRPGSWAHSPSEFKAMARDNAHTLALQFAESMPPLTDSDVRSISVPTLLIGGEKSPSIFRRNLDWLGACFPHAARVTIAGASHGMNLAHLHAFNRAVLNFLDAHRTETAHEASAYDYSKSKG